MTCIKCGQEVPDGAFCILCGWEQRKRKPRRKAMKRPNGTGSVYKLPGHRTRPWVAYHTAGFDENGNPVGGYARVPRTYTKQIAPRNQRD